MARLLTLHCHRTRLLMLTLALSVCFPFWGAFSQDSEQYPSMQEEVRLARVHLNTAIEAARLQDKRTLRKSLAQGEATLTRALQANPHSREAAETLGVVHYYKGYYIDQDAYKKCIDVLVRVLEVNPNAEQAIRYLAHAYSQLNDGRNVIRYANHLESISNDPDLIREMNELKRPFQRELSRSQYKNRGYDNSNNYSTRNVATSLSVAPDVIREATALLDQGRQQGLRYLDSNDKKAKKSAKKSLERAEKLLKKAVKKNRNCESCLEKLVETYFYKAYFKFSKNYNDCIKTASKGLERFPDNDRLAFFQGYAYYNSGKYADASKALNDYLIMSTGDPETEEQVRQILDDAQQRFLNGWYKHADYYRSKDSRIDVFNNQTFQFQTIFQVTPQWEMNVGSQAFAQLTSQAQQVQDPELQSYLEDLVNRLVTKTPGPYSNYKITVLNSPAVNAVTVPGHVLIYTGLLAFVESESQLAGVLAHELAHNFGHHAARRFISALRAQSISNAINQALRNEKQWVQIAAQLTTTIGMDLFLKAYSRGKEKEADLYGSHIMFNAGYNPTSLSAFFLKLYKHNPKQPVKFLSTHPPSPDRANYLTDYLESFPLDREMRIDSEAFQKIKARFIPAVKQKNKGHGVLPPVQ